MQSRFIEVKEKIARFPWKTGQPEIVSLSVLKRRSDKGKKCKQVSLLK